MKRYVFAAAAVVLLAGGSAAMAQMPPGGGPGGPPAGQPGPGGPPPGGPEHQGGWMMHHRPHGDGAAFFRFRRGDAEMDIKCPASETVQACVAAAGSLMDKVSGMQSKAQ